ncbi:hypothetical protein DFS34DRAFT_8416 [Phlyctochytrium arcticum]|nr:hypothetical protein DFS34DRAFT_8416 [Phlyctochytrium arcticum]
MVCDGGSVHPTSFRDLSGIDVWRSREIAGFKSLCPFPLLQNNARGREPRFPVMVVASFINKSLLSFQDVWGRCLHPDDTLAVETEPTKIDELHLHSNQISRIDAPILSRFCNLVSLDLSSNLIDNLDGIEASPNLIHLNVANNRISRIHNLHKLPKLRTLDASFNVISDLVPLPKCSQVLQYLDIKSNNLRDWDALNPLRSCHSLTYLVLKGNMQSSQMNGVCQRDDYTPSMVFQKFPFLHSVDGQDIHGRPAAAYTFVAYKYHEPSTTVSGSGESSQNSIKPAVSPDPGRVPKAAPADIEKYNTLWQRLYVLEEQLDKVNARDLQYKSVTSSAEPKPREPNIQHIEKVLEDIQQLVRHLPELARNRTESGNQRQASKQSRIPTRENSSHGQVRQKNTDRKSSQAYSTKSAKVNTASEYDTSSITEKPPVARAKSVHRASVTRQKKGAALKENDENERPKSLSDAITLACNNKLIKALELEEARQKAVIQKYASEVKRLSDAVIAESEKFKAVKLANANLHDEKLLSVHTTTQEKLTETEESYAQLKQKHEQLAAEHEANAAELKLAKTNLRDAEQVNSSAKGDSNSLSQQVGHLTQELREVREKELEARKQLCLLEDEMHRLSVRLLKDREISKVKLAEARKESEIFRLTNQQLQKDISMWQEKYMSIEAVARKEILELKQKADQDLLSAVRASNDTKERAAMENSSEVQTLKAKLKASEKAYAALENEFRSCMEDENRRYRLAQQAFTDLSTRFTSETKALERATEKEHEMTHLIRNLTQLVSEQREKVDQMRSSHDEAAKAFEEKVKRLENQIKSHDFSLQSHNKMRDELQAKTAKIHQLQAELKRLSTEFANQTFSSKTEKTNLKAQLEAIQMEQESIVSERAAHDQALRVKNKMLEDQLDTIKTLKQNLENKTREFKAIESDHRDRQEAFSRRLDDERQARLELEQELERQMYENEKLSAACEELSDERASLKKDLLAALKKVQERNDSIHAIEEEVTKIRQIFKAKEAKLQEEKEALTAAQTFAHSDLTIALDTAKKQLAAFERERIAMTQSLQRQQATIENYDMQNAKVQADLQATRCELERQRSKMNEKMDILKAAIADTN